LSEPSLGFGGLALPESNYKRLQRFFRGFALDYAVIAKAVVSWMNIPQPWVLSIDRTPWEFGHHVCNILTVGVVRGEVALPVLKKHGRRAKSLFRLGLDHIRHLVLNPSSIHEDDFRLSLQFLSCILYLDLFLDTEDSHIY
jgi:hypothetical protein